MSILRDAIFNPRKVFKKDYRKESLHKKGLSYFANCQKILDVGCGVGEFVALDRKRIVGLDKNAKSLDICKKKKLKVVLGEATKLPFPDRSFDGVHCSHVIEHLLPQDAHKMLKEIIRVLKKGGIFVLSTPILWKGFYDDFTHIKPYYPKSIRRYLCKESEQKTLADIKAKFEEVDFYWRYPPLPLPGRIGWSLASFFYQFGLHSIQRNGYTLVFKKVK